MMSAKEWGKVQRELKVKHASRQQMVRGVDLKNLAKRRGAKLMEKLMVPRHLGSWLGLRGFPKKEVSACAVP